MAIPFAAMHTDAGECGNAKPVSEDPGQMTRPFAGLKAQLDENG